MEGLKADWGKWSILNWISWGQENLGIMNIESVIQNLEPRLPFLASTVNHNLSFRPPLDVDLHICFLHTTSLDYVNSLSVICLTRANRIIFLLYFIYRMLSSLQTWHFHNPARTNLTITLKAHSYYGMKRKENLP